MYKKSLSVLPLYSLIETSIDLSARHAFKRIRSSFKRELISAALTSTL